MDQAAQMELGTILKRSELIEKALRKELKWMEIAEALHLSPRQVRRLRERYDALGAKGLEDYRRRHTPKNKLPDELCKEVSRIYREDYKDWM
jgi:methylphosphotriester-DNA--protein-cysteine methyltransferase